MENELAGRDEYFAARRSASEDLDDTLEAAWDQGQEEADEHQVADDFLAGAHDRAGTTDAQKFEIAYDAGIIRKDREAARAAAAAGNAPDRPAAAISEKAAKDALFDAHLSGSWDGMAGVPAKPGEQRPEATPSPPAPGALTPEDRAALAQAPAGTRAVIDRHLAAHQANYSGVDALAGRWGGYLSERGAATPEQQVGVLDNLLQTEHALATGSPEQKIAIVQKIARDYGVGAPSGGPAPQAQMQAPPAPQATGDALVDQLQRTHHEQQAAAWAEAMATAGPQGAAEQRVHHARNHIMEVASAKTNDGTAAYPYFAEVGPQIYGAIQRQIQQGQRPDLVSAYHTAVSLRPDIQQHHAAGLQQELRAFREANPVTFDPRVRDRMRSVALGHQRTGTPTNPAAILAEALRREPDVAARNARHVATAKQRGHAAMPTLDQSLEAAWQVGTGQR